MKKEKGITLIALVVTVIVLLILAGVALKLIVGGDGILGKAENSVKKTKEAVAKEKVELLLAEYNIEKITEGTGLEGFLEAKKTSKEIEDFQKLEDKEKEWKILVDGYWFEVDEDSLQVKTSALPGPMPGAIATILTTGYVFQGSGNVEVKIDVTLPGELEGAEVTITPPEGISKVGENYAVGSNGTHNFIVIVKKDGHEYRKTAYVTVDKILDAVDIGITNVKYNEFTINVNNNYPVEANVQYIYYINNIAKTSQTVNKSYQLTELTAETEYAVKVEAYLPGNSTPLTITEIVTTPEKSYEISSIEELEAMKNDLGANYKLTRSLDFKDRNSYETEERYNYYNVDANEDGNPDNSWSPIGPFSGSLNGQYHKISNLYIYSDSRLGFFEVIKAGASVQNIIFDDAQVQGNTKLGILAAYLEEGGSNIPVKLTYVGVKGKVIGNYGEVGGFAGDCYYCDFDRCFSDVYFESSGAYSGGICGYFGTSLKMTNCFSSGSSKSSSWCGGIGAFPDDTSKVVLTNVYSNINFLGSSGFGFFNAYGFAGESNSCYFNKDLAKREDELRRTRINNRSNEKSSII